jgi:hypothetical protein
VAPLDGAKRERVEEVGQPVPDGALVEEWSAGNGLYAGYVWSISSEAGVVINADERAVLNPDDPDGDQVETLAWWDPDHLGGNPAVRRELQTSMPQVRGALAIAGDTATAGKAAEAQQFRAWLRNLREGGRTYRRSRSPTTPGTSPRQPRGSPRKGSGRRAPASTSRWRSRAGRSLPGRATERSLQHGIPCRFRPVGQFVRDQVQFTAAVPFPDPSALSVNTSSRPASSGPLRRALSSEAESSRRWLRPPQHAGDFLGRAELDTLLASRGHPSHGVREPRFGRAVPSKHHPEHVQRCNRLVAHVGNHQFALRPVA